MRRRWSQKRSGQAAVSAAQDATTFGFGLAETGKKASQSFVYDATNRTWLAMDPIKDGLNWYQYASSNPTTNWDPTGLAAESYFLPLQGSAPLWANDSATFDPLKVLGQMGYFVTGVFASGFDNLRNTVTTIGNVIGSVFEPENSSLDEFGLGTIGRPITPQTPVYNVPEQYQDAFSAGYLLGNIGSIVIDTLEIVGGGALAIAGTAGSVVLALPTGGTAVIPGAVATSAGIALAVDGVAGLVAATTAGPTPNIYYSKSGTQGSNSNSLRPEAAVTGSKKHGVNWTEGPARAIKEGKPQGQWAASDLDYATEMASTLKPRESAVFDLPEGSQSIVHMPDGTTQPATKMWLRNNGTGTWHGYPMP